MEDLNARALVVEKGSTSPAVAAAKAKGIRILELGWAEGDPSGSFSILGEPSGTAANGGLAEPDDIALILHTSGTTSRPKIVPLGQANIAASARHIAATTQLTPADPLPQHHAALPHPRPDRGGDDIDPRGRGRCSARRASTR